MFLRGATGGMDGWVMEVREGINRKIGTLASETMEAPATGADADVFGLL